MYDRIQHACGTVLRLADGAFSSIGGRGQNGVAVLYLVVLHK